MLSPWDAYQDSEYFDKLLVSSNKRPAQLVLKNSQPEVLATANSGCEAANPKIAGASSPMQGPAADLDRQTLEELRSVSNLEAVHDLQHYLYFPHQQGAKSAARALRDRQFLVEERLSADGTDWLVLAKHRSVPTESAIAGVRKLMEQVAADNAGDYDGWEAKVTPHE